MLTPVKTLGQRIRERREELDLSLREFAKQLDCSPPFVSDVEHGRRFPSEEMLQDMARLLKLDAAQLKEFDPRLPVEEFKRAAEQDSDFGFAFRQALGKGLTAEDLRQFARNRRTPFGGKK
jgi:transcriptional regulator with XRE-family HTH domain